MTKFEITISVDDPQHTFSQLSEVLDVDFSFALRSVMTQVFNDTEARKHLDEKYGMRVTRVATIHEPTDYPQGTP